MTTALSLLGRCREAGIILTADGDRISFDAPADVAVPVEELRRCKVEVLAALRGDYAGAAAALVARVADPVGREALAYLFEERAGVREFEGILSRGEAEYMSYCDLASTIEEAAP